MPKAKGPRGRRKQGVPGCSLVEIGPEPEPRNRRITIRELPGGGR